MQNRLRMPALVVAMILGASAGCDRTAQGKAETHGHGHDGGEHGHDQGHGEGLDPISVTVFTDKLQLFMEYPHLVTGKSARFLAHLTVLQTGEPIRSGSLHFKVTDTEGNTRKVVLDTPKRDGLFVPEWVFNTPGKHRLQLLLSSPQAQDMLEVGIVIVHADADSAFHAAEAATSDPGAPGTNSIPFLLEQQWKIGTLYEKAARRTLVHRLPLPGRIVAPHGASAVVSPPVDGRLWPPPDGRLPQVGDDVEAGQVLAMVEPPLPVTDGAQLSANRAWLQTLEMELAQRELEIDTKGMEVGRSLIQSAARLDFAQRAMGRVVRLKEKGVGTEQQYDEAQQDLRFAEAEHEGAKALKRSYERARQRLAQLRSRATVAETETAATNPSLQMSLRAPIAGKIVSVHHIQGEHLDAHQELFRIVNTEHVWVEASISEFDLAELLENPGATMELPSYPGRSFDILGSAGGRLVNIGTVIEPETRTVSIVFELPNPDGLFRVGMFADVYLQTRV
ncbi:MAG: efflux RND transporter periplasmic adaptor subunit, partial [Planctomycetes bacterium]|nr:efflux RND transporter periplasmic adaptor subunit [Planctomycetota bacterium]